MPNDGFINESVKTDVTFLTIYDGMLCKKRATPGEGYEKYVTKHSKKALGKEVYVHKITSVNGYLIGIKKEERETLDKTSKYFLLIFTFQSPTTGKLAKLEVGIKSNFVAAIAKRIETIDLFKPLEFGAFFSNADNKEIDWFKQNGVKVPANFTKEKPRDLPQWTENETTGEKSNTEYWTYLIKLLRNTASEETLNEVKAMLDGSQADFAADNSEVDAPGFADANPAAPDDDIPF